MSSSSCSAKLDALSEEVRKLRALVEQTPRLRVRGEVVELTVALPDPERTGTTGVVVYAAPAQAELGWRPSLGVQLWYRGNNVRSFEWIEGDPADADPAI